MGSLHNITAPVAKATAADPSLTEGDVAGLSQDLSGRLRVVADLDASDIQIGAIELKNSTTDTRANVLAASTAAQATDTPLVVALHPSSPLGAGSAIVGKVGIDQTTPGTTNAIVETATAAAGGVNLTNRLLSAANTTNATNVKGSPGRVYGIQGYNAASALRYLKLYNKATAPSVGSDTPIKTIAIPGTTAFALDFPIGYYFSTGIGFGLTTGSADNDTGALTAGDILALNIDYV